MQPATSLDRLSAVPDNQFEPTDAAIYSWYTPGEAPDEPEAPRAPQAPRREAAAPPPTTRWTQLALVGAAGTLLGLGLGLVLVLFAGALVLGVVLWSDRDTVPTAAVEPIVAAAPASAAPAAASAPPPSETPREEPAEVAKVAPVAAVPVTRSAPRPKPAAPEAAPTPQAVRTVRVLTTLPALEVAVDGSTQGRTPAKLELSEGPHTLSFVIDGRLVSVPVDISSTSERLCIDVASGKLVGSSACGVGGVLR